MRAYFTVEAALILPVTLGIYVLLIYAMFFQYDRSLMEKNMAVLAIRGTLVPSDSNEEIMDFIRQQAAEINKSKYIAFDQESVSGSVTGGRVEVLGTGRVKVLFTRLINRTGGNDWQITARYSNRRLDPTMVIRACRRLIQEKQEE